MNASFQRCTARPFGVLLAAALLPAVLAGPAQAQELLYELSPPYGQGGLFGQAVSAVPDVDGDGVNDLVVGAAGTDYTVPGVDAEGADSAYVFSGATGALLYRLGSPQQGNDGWFGYSVAGLPDVDGDGRGDLLVGAPFEYVAGRAYVFSGATGGSLRTLYPSGVSEGFGGGVASVPDLDGDGVPDLLVRSGEGHGRVYVFSGATGVRLYRLNSPSSEPGSFGASVSGVPDLDGDGRGDIVVGDPYEYVGQRYDAGRAYVFSGATGAYLRTLISPGPSFMYYFGIAVRGVPDLDGDGRGDLLVGESQRYQPGAAYVYSGATGGLLQELASPHPEDGGRFGESVSSTGPGDGTGPGEILIGAPGELSGYRGRAYVFSGTTGALVSELVSPNAVGDGNFGWSAAGVGDVNDDGTADFLIGAPGAGPVEGVGRAYLYAGLPAFTLAAVPLDSPVPQGGRLRFTVAIANNTAGAATGRLRLVIEDATGLTYTRTLSRGVTLEAGQTASGVFTIPVPQDTSPGTYNATVSALSGGWNPIASDVFTFEVVETAAHVSSEVEDRRGVWGEVEVLDAGGLRLDGAAPPTAEVGTSEVPSASVVTPNPATSRAVLTFSLAAPAEVRLALHDVLGREVATVEAGTLGAGARRLALDVAALPAGVYVWRLVAGDRVEVGRLTVAR